MKLSPEKQKQVALASLITALLVLALYFLGIQPLGEKASHLRREAGRVQGEIENLKKVKERLSLDAQAIGQYRRKLSRFEEQMPEGAIDTWTIEKVSQVSQPHALTLSSTQVLSTPELSAILLPNSQYETYYYTCKLRMELPVLGEFLMNLENTFPAMVVDSLTIMAGAGGTPYLHEAEIRVSFLRKKK